MLGLAALTDESVTRDDILQQNSSGGYDGIYLNTDDDRIDEDSVVLDPFTGGGVTHAELNRLGATTVGYELNPVAWWSVKKSIEEVDLDSLRQGHSF